MLNKYNMIDNKYYLKKQRGDILVEFLIVASSVLVTLFIVIPILAKVVDVRHKNEQASQYIAWERSVWHGKKIGSNKTKSNLELEARHRIFSTGNSLVNTMQGTTPVNDTSVDSFHYFTDRSSGTPKYTSILGARGGASNYGFNVVSEGSYDQPNANLFKTASKPVSLFTSWKMKAGGYYKNKTTAVVKQPTWIPSFTSNNLTMNTEKSLLVDGWGVGGRKDNKKLVNTLQPTLFAGTEKVSFGGYNVSPRGMLRLYTRLYNNDIIDVIDIADDLVSKNSDKEHGLDFEYVDTDHLINTNQLGTY